MELGLGQWTGLFRSIGGYKDIATLFLLASSIVLLSLLFHCASIGREIAGIAKKSGTNRFPTLRSGGSRVTGQEMDLASNEVSVFQAL